MKDISRTLHRVLTQYTGVAFARATTPTPAPEFTHECDADALNSPGRLYGHAYGDMICSARFS
jgi:hypothetical protein